MLLANSKLLWLESVGVNMIKQQAYIIAYVYRIPWVYSQRKTGSELEKRCSRIEFSLHSELQTIDSHTCSHAHLGTRFINLISGVITVTSQATRTGMDRNGQEWTGMDRNGQEWTGRSCGLFGFGRLLTIAETQPHKASRHQDDQKPQLS